MDIAELRAEIAQRQRRILAQRKEILALHKAGKPTAEAEALLTRMLDKVDELGRQRDRLRGDELRKYPGTNKAIRGTQRRGL